MLELQQRAASARAAADAERQSRRQDDDRYVTGGVNWNGFSLETLIKMVAERASPSQLDALADEWRQHGSEVARTSADLQRSMNTLMNYWSGQGADEASHRVTTSAAWVGDLGRTAEEMAAPIENAGGALRSAQSTMPGKPGDNWAAFAGGGAAIGFAVGGPIGAAFGAALGGIASAFGFGSSKKKLKRKAVQTMQRYELALLGVDGTTPQFGLPADGINPGINPNPTPGPGVGSPTGPPAPPGGSGPVLTTPTPVTTPSGAPPFGSGGPDARWRGLTGNPGVGGIPNPGGGTGPTLGGGIGAIPPRVAPGVRGGGGGFGRGAGAAPGGAGRGGGSTRGAGSRGVLPGRGTGGRGSVGTGGFGGRGGSAADGEHQRRTGRGGAGMPGAGGRGTGTTGRGGAAAGRGTTGRGGAAGDGDQQRRAGRPGYRPGGLGETVASGRGGTATPGRTGGRRGGSNQDSEQERRTGRAAEGPDGGAGGLDRGGYRPGGLGETVASGRAATGMPGRAGAGGRRGDSGQDSEHERKVGRTADAPGGGFGPDGGGAGRAGYGAGGLGETVASGRAGTASGRAGAGGRRGSGQDSEHERKVGRTADGPDGGGVGMPDPGGYRPGGLGADAGAGDDARRDGRGRFGRPGGSDPHGSGGYGAKGANVRGEEDEEHQRRVPIEEDPFSSADLKAAPPVIGL